MTKLWVSKKNEDLLKIKNKRWDSRETEFHPSVIVGRKAFFPNFSENKHSSRLILLFAVTTE